MKSKAERRARVALDICTAVVYMAMPLSFFLCLSITNPQILRISRTAAITISTYILLEYLFMRIYGGYQPGEIRIRPNISSLSLATAFTDLATYMQLQIMNVNDANNSHLELFGTDALLLLLAVGIQLAVIVSLAFIGSRLYFKANPPLRSCVVTDNEEDMEIIDEKLRMCGQRFDVERIILYTSANVRENVKKAEAVILYHLPPAAHQEIIAYAYKHKKVLYFDLNVGNIVASHSKPYMLDDVLMHSHTVNGLTLSQRFIKRAIDIALSALALVALCPVFAGCAIAVKLNDGGSVFYRQKRITRDATVFDVLKFRTMKEHAQDEAQVSVCDGDERITGVGGFLRKWRLDELPQLVNILKGDMSLVGPRPEMLENVITYTQELPEFAYRDRVKAGLTGIAQISGKYNTSPREKLMMDITYIENYSLWLDIKLMLKTLLVFFKPDSTEAFHDGGGLGI